MLNIGRILRKLSEDESVQNIGFGKSFYLVSQSVEADVSVTKLYWSSGCAITQGNPAYLNNLGDLKEVYRTKSSQIEILDTTVSGIVFRDGAFVYEWYDNILTTLASEGSMVKQLTYAGSVSYSDRTINFEDVGKFWGKRLRYESIEHLSSIEESHFPVITKIEWD